MLKKYYLHETSVDAYGYILPLYQKIFDLMLDTGYFDSTDSAIDSSGQSPLNYFFYMKFIDLPYYLICKNAGGSRTFTFEIRTDKTLTGGSGLTTWSNLVVASSGLDNGTIQISIATDEDNIYFGFQAYNGTGYNLKAGVVKFIDDTTSYILLAPDSNMATSVKLYTSGTGTAYDYQIANTFNAKVSDADLGLYRDADITTSGDFIQLDYKILNINYVVTGHTFSQFMPIRVNDELYIPFNNYTIYKYGVAGVVTD